MYQLLLNIKSKLNKLWVELLFQARSVNWILLASIILVFHVNMKYKIVALLLTFLITLKSRLPFKEIPIFYYVLLSISIIHSTTALFYYDESSYFLVSLIGILYWTIALVFSLQMKNIVKITKTEKIKKTITLLFFLNFIVCLYNLLMISIETGVINPYTFKGLSEKYYMSTGDYIFGLFGNTSAVNAAACLLGTIYFFKVNKFMAIITLISLLLTTSNLNNIFLVLILTVIFIFDKAKLNKAYSLCLFALVVTFYAKISPDNFAYLNGSNQVDNTTISVDSPLMQHNAEILTKLEQYKHTISEKEHPIKNQTNKKRTDSTLVLQKPETIAEIEQHKDSIAKEFQTILNQTNTEPIDSSLMLHKAEIITEVEQHKNSIAETQHTFENHLSTDTSITNEHSKKTFSQEIEQALNTLENTKADYAYFRALEEKQNKVISQKKNLYIDTEYDSLYLDRYPGKLTSYIQTYEHAFKNIKTFLIGSGQACYSSKLAFDVSGTGEGGSLTQKFTYISEDFAQDHLKIYIHFFSQSMDKHSVINSPFSVYNQVFGEYGLIGFLALIFGYGFYFLKRFRKLDYGRYLILAIAMLFSTSYWFESLTIIILFELMMFLELKEYNNE